MPLTPVRLTSKIRQLDHRGAFSLETSPPSRSLPTAIPLISVVPVLTHGCWHHHRTTNTVAVFAGVIASPIVMPCPQMRRSRFEIWIAREIWGTRDNEPTLEIVPTSLSVVHYINSRY